MTGRKGGRELEGGRKEWKCVVKEGEWEGEGWSTVVRGITTVEERECSRCLLRGRVEGGKCW